MTTHLTDEQLQIAPGDSIPVRAAKVSIKASRRLNRDDDPDTVKIVTGERPFNPGHHILRSATSVNDGRIGPEPLEVDRPAVTTSPRHQDVTAEAGPEHLRRTELQAGPTYEGAIQNLIDQIRRLPGIGPKVATRIALQLVAAGAEGSTTELIDALLHAREKVRFCEICCNVTEAEQCRICRDPRRDPAMICVVERSQDVAAIEFTQEFRGRYHVLWGAIDPIAGVGPDDLRVRELLARLADGEVTEVIIATDPNLEGEATATYLARQLRRYEGVQVTRLSSRLPVGGNLDYADEVTLGSAIRERHVLSEV